MTYLRRELLLRPKTAGQSGTAHNCRGERTLDKQGDQRVFSFTRATHSSVMAPSASCTSSPLSRWVYSLMILEFRLVGGLELRNNETIAIGLLYAMKA